MRRRRLGRAEACGWAGYEPAAALLGGRRRRRRSPLVWEAVRRRHHLGFREMQSWPSPPLALLMLVFVIRRREHRSHGTASGIHRLQASAGRVTMACPGPDGAARPRTPAAQGPGGGGGSAVARAEGPETEVAAARFHNCGRSFLPTSRGGPSAAGAGPCLHQGGWASRAKTGQSAAVGDAWRCSAWEAGMAMYRASTGYGATASGLGGAGMIGWRGRRRRTDETDSCHHGELISDATYSTDGVETVSVLERALQRRFLFCARIFTVLIPSPERARSAGSTGDAWRFPGARGGFPCHAIPLPRAGRGLIRPGRRPSVRQDTV